MSYLDLPADDNEARTEQELNDKLGDVVPQRVYRCYDDAYAYLVAVSLHDNGISGATTLLHKDQLSPEQLQAMADEAAKVVFETRVTKRRVALAKSQTRVPSSTKANEDYFEEDIKFFEAVMMDKFNFRKLICTAASTTMTPTIVEKW
jgi:hypothetical protein